MSLPVSVIVSHKKTAERQIFFAGFCLPSIYQNEPEMVYVEDEPGPPARAHNHAARLAQSEFLFHTNDDYILRHDCLAHMLAALRRNPDATFAYCDVLYIRLPEAPVEAEPPVWHHRPRDYGYEMKTRYMAEISCLLRREHVKGIEFDENPIIQNVYDLDYFLTLDERGLYGVYVPETLIHIYTFDRGLSATLPLEPAIERLRRKHSNLA